MRVVWALVLLAGCYSPTFSSGAPCDPALNNCPAGQQCLPAANGFACGGGDPSIDAAFDAAIDAAAPDIDGDGVLNAMDNCPTKANTDQADDETDGVGDICDPCPVVADNTDDDMDGVGNACDPNPAIPGDSIVLFESFRGNTIPAGWTTSGNGTWTFANGEAEIMLGGSQVGSLRTNLPATANMTAFTLVVVDNTSGPDNAAGIANPFTTNYDGSQCALVRTGGGSGGGNAMSLYDLTTDTTIQETLLSWLFATHYVVIVQREGTDYTCAFASTTGTVLASPAGTNTSAHAGAQSVGLRARGVVARYRFLMIVQSP